MAALRCIFFLSLLSSCLAAKYVMFPMFGRSHFLVFAKLGEELASRGHEVQVFVGDTETYAHKVPFARSFKTSHEFKDAMQQVVTLIGRDTGIARQLSALAHIQSIYCDSVLSNTEAMKAAENADLIVGDALDMCGSLIAARFSLPFVTVFASSLSTTTAHAFGLPLTPAYVPQLQSLLTDNLSLVGRIQNVYHWILNYWTFHNGMAPYFQDLKDRYKIAPNKSLYEVFTSVDLIIGQMGFFLDYPRPILPNTRVVGPLLTSPSKPLPAELEQFMQRSGDNGVIVVAFGTVLGKMNKAILLVMAEAFATLPQQVIWKLSEAEASSITVSENVKIASWLPQNDILGHPKTRLFVGHAGLNGMFESIYHGVPMICSPFFGDQFYNAQAAKHAGFADILRVGEATTEQLVSVIHIVLKDPSYRESAARISKAIKQLPRTPVQEAADWVEYTRAQGGLQHLRPRGLDLPFYQLYLLDILSLAVMIAIVFFFVMKFLFKFIKSLFMFKTKEKAP